MSHKENKSHEEKASGFKKNDLILVLLYLLRQAFFLQDIYSRARKAQAL